MISIIIPVYNAGNHLKQCLDSLLKQTYRDIEIICVNDGSTDNSDEILKECAYHDPRLKVITQPNAGVSAARNRGVSAAQGDWLMFVDADDWVDITTCEVAMKAVAEYHADLVFWPYVREFGNGKQAPRLLIERDTVFEGEELRLLHRKIVGPVDNELSDPTLLHSWGTVWGKLYKREAVGATQFTDTRIVGSAEDVLFNIEVFVRVKKAFYVNRPMYHYRKHDSSFTGGYNEKLNERWKMLYTLMEKEIDRNNLAEDFRDALFNRIALGLIGQGLNECKSPRSRKDKIRMMGCIITEEHYRKAVQRLPLIYFPLHWRLFFWAAKNRHTNLLYFLSVVMTKLR